MLNGMPEKGTKIILLFLRLHPSTAFQTLLLTMRATPRLLRSCCPQLSLFSCSVVSDSLWPQACHASLACFPLLFPGVCSNSGPLSQWCYPTISSSVAPFSSHPQSFPALRSFTTGWLFVSDGQNTGPSASVFPMNIQGWFPLGLSGLISLLSRGLSRASPAP